MSEAKPKKERKPLGMTCSTPNCEKGLHSLLPARAKHKTNQEAQEALVLEERTEYSVHEKTPDSMSGRCWSCGVTFVDLSILHERDPAKIEYAISCFKLTNWNRYWWDVPIDQWAVNQARRRGRANIPLHAEKQIRKSISAAHPFREGHQIPFEGDILYYAQHATGTCCRKCLAKWHGIPQGRELMENEIQYCAYILTQYVNVRLSDLTDEGEKVPPIRQTHNRIPVVKPEEQQPCLLL